jgi:hypothetical protein
MDDWQHQIGRNGTRGGGRAPALPGFTRLSEAETRDLHLFIAPERLARSRRMLASGLFTWVQAEARAPGNDNHA